MNKQYKPDQAYCCDVGVFFPFQGVIYLAYIAFHSKDWLLLEANSWFKGRLLIERFIEILKHVKQRVHFWQPRFLVL